jgi:hypothetical protein
MPLIRPFLNEISVVYPLKDSWPCLRTSSHPNGAPYSVITPSQYPPRLGCQGTNTLAYFETEEKRFFRFGSVSCTSIFHEYALTCFLLFFAAKRQRYDISLSLSGPLL